MSSPCAKNIAAETGVSEKKADEFLGRAMTLAQLRAEATQEALPDAMRAIAGELRAEEKMMAKIRERNSLLTVQKLRDIARFVDRFVIKGRTMGEGVLAFLQGSARPIEGARASVDYQAKAVHGKYFGRMVAQMERAGVLSAFKNPDTTLMRDIYREMGERKPGQPSKSTTGNDTAFKIANIISQTMEEVVARQNRAGAYITRVPDFVARQTHDQTAIRAAGGLGNNSKSKQASFQAWYAFTMPLIDPAKTFNGGKADALMRDLHDKLYSGIRTTGDDGTNIMGAAILGPKHEVPLLHFKDADSALAYNQKFGIKDFKEQIMYDLRARTRAIALMENLGPNPEAALRQLIKDLEIVGSQGDDAARHVDSLADWRIMAAYNEISGRNESSVNPTLSNALSNVKMFVQVAKMGSVVLSSFADKAFLQAEMASQAMGHLQTFAGQITHAVKSDSDKEVLRYMGLAMDGLMGNALSRYSNHSRMSGWGHSLQKYFFDLNGLNLWTDSSKGTAGLLMAAHLGDHSKFKFAEMPEELQRYLSMYDITPSRWDAIRKHVVDHEGHAMIFPDAIKVTDAELSKLVTERGLTPSPANIARERDAIDTALRTYYIDRVDHAIPTPGAAERKYSTFDTRAGTPLGEAVRMVMLFKSFPITVMRKIMGREIYGRGADSLREWLMHDHRGKFNLAMLVAMATAAGYVSGAVKDALKGRTPRELVGKDGLNWKNINEMVIRGGSLGIMGDILLSEYESTYRGFLQSVAGPIVGQAETLMDIKTGIQRGESVKQASGKLIMDNTPLINLFYIRPILDYLVLWNLQEMMSPGSLRRMETAVQKNNKQGFFMKPSENRMEY